MSRLHQVRYPSRFRKWPCMNLQELLNHTFAKKPRYFFRGWEECACCGVYSSSTVHGLCPKCKALRDEMGEETFLDYLCNAGLDYYCRRGE